MKNVILLIITAILVGMGTARADEYAIKTDGLIKVATACMRSQPGHSNELVSQAVMGTPVKLLEQDGNWYLAETPEGYRGYIIANAIAPKDSVEMYNWRESKRVMYIGHYTGRIVSRDGHGTPVSDIHAGSVLQIIPGKAKDSIDVLLPDGRSGRLARKAVTPLSDFRRHRLDTQRLIDMARSLMGVSYLWGGTTTAGMDCSGLAKICYLNQGIILRRDAGQQAVTGTILGDDFREYRRGDLVFFKSATTGRIVHVGIYDGDGLYVHSSGRVRVNSLDPESPLYIPSNILASGCRIDGNINTDGITLITSTPAYFNL
ncbi:MAG: C40 family peptidase [Muribaculaceae bacterium]|nr:C40 family peptidase [Muribaculaceae bacterium]